MPPANYNLLISVTNPVVDGSATGTAGAAATLGITLSTTNSNDVIVIQSVAEQNSTSAAPQITSITGGGLTFVSRSTQFYAAGGANTAFYQEVWWAAAPTALSSVTFTIHYSATVDNAAATAFGVSGCNTTSPWDANNSQPSVTTALIGGVNAPITTGASSTTSTNDLLLYFGATAGGSSSPKPAAFTLIKTQYYDGQNIQVDLTSAWENATTPVSGATYTTGNFEASAPGTVIMDALAPGVPTVAAVPFAQLDQPNPSRLPAPRGDQITWLQSPAEPGAIPFAQLDQPNPVRLSAPTADRLTWLQSPAVPPVVVVPTAPFAQLDQPNPTRLSPARGDQITWTNAENLSLAFSAPIVFNGGTFLWNSTTS